ncbi:hypothetical protein GEMRC1_003586 [Eukaryota sp. GEM-RC1]
MSSSNELPPVPPPCRHDRLKQESDLCPPTELFQIRSLNLEDTPELTESLPPESLAFFTPNCFSLRDSILKPDGTSYPSKSTKETTEHLEDFAKLQKEHQQSLKKQAKLQERKQQLRIKQEKDRSKRLGIWNKDVVPNLPDIIHSKKVLKLWRQGIPSSCKKHIWPLAVGNQLGITEDLFKALLDKSEKKPLDSFVANEHSQKLIVTDIPRTFPSLSFFSDGPWKEALHDCLQAFVEYRLDIGYVQGMSFICAILLLFLETLPAFVCFSNLIVNNPILNSFYTFNQERIEVFYNVFDHLLHQFLPRQASHLKSIDLHCSLFLHDWFNTVYSRCLSLECVSRIWDLWFLDGDVVLYRVALSILFLIRKELLYEFEIALRAIKRIGEVDELELFEVYSKLEVSKQDYSSIVSKYIERSL